MADMNYEDINDLLEELKKFKKRKLFIVKGEEFEKGVNGNILQVKDHIFIPAYLVPLLIKNHIIDLNKQICGLPLVSISYQQFKDIFNEISEDICRNMFKDLINSILEDLMNENGIH